MPLPKFSFIPERQIGSKYSPKYRVQILKSGILRFPPDVVHVYELEGKYLRLFADLGKKAIGWSIIEGKTNMQNLDDARIIKSGASGALLGISRILRMLNIEKGSTWKSLEAKKYVSLLQSDNIYYVVLDPETMEKAE